MIGNFCAMAVRDTAVTGKTFVLQKHGSGSCHVLDSGTVIRGRREKNQIVILAHDKKGKLGVEHWPIVGQFQTKMLSLQRVVFLTLQKERDAQRKLSKV